MLSLFPFYYSVVLYFILLRLFSSLPVEVLSSDCPKNNIGVVGFNLISSVDKHYIAHFDLSLKYIDYLIALFSLFPNSLLILMQ